MAGSHDADRDAVLRRRALLVASALAALAPKSAQAEPLAMPEEDELGACSTTQSSAETVALAEQRLRVAEEHIAQGDRDGARLEFIRIYREVRSESALMSLIHLREIDGDMHGAIRAARFHLDCVASNSPTVRARLDVLLADSATLIVRLPATAPSADEQWRLDGRVVPRDLLVLGLRVKVGGHTLVRTTGFGREEFPLVVSAGEVSEVSVGSGRRDPPPQPCLSIAPDQPEEPWRVHAGLIGPLVMVGLEEEPSVFGGGGLRLAVAAQPASGFWLELDTFGTLALGDEVLAGTFGGTLEVRYHPHPLAGFGVGVTGGYLDVDNRDASAFEDSGFFGPVIIPMSMLAGPAALSLRVPLWFSSVHDEGGVSELGLSAIVPHLTISAGGPMD